MIVSTANAPVTVGISTESWYVGKASAFSSELYNVNTSQISTISTPVTEVKNGEYSLTLSLPAGEYFVYVYNSELYEGAEAAHLLIQESNIDAVSSSVTTLNNSVNNMSNLIQTIYDIEVGAWQIVGTQMIFYKSDNVTEIARFNLADMNGVPSNSSVFKRTVV